MRVDDGVTVAAGWRRSHCTTTIAQFSQSLRPVLEVDIVSRGQRRSSSEPARSLCQSVSVHGRWTVLSTAKMCHCLQASWPSHVCLSVCLSRRWLTHSKLRARARAWVLSVTYLLCACVNMIERQFVDCSTLQQRSWRHVTVEMNPYECEFWLLIILYSFLVLYLCGISHKSTRLSLRYYAVIMCCEFIIN